MKVAAPLALALVLIALTVVGAAKASTPGDVVKVAWYLKGEGDATFVGSHAHVTKLVCHPSTGPKVRCELTVAGYRPYPVCSTGLFLIHDFAVYGEWSTPVRCAGGAGTRNPGA